MMMNRDKLSFWIRLIAILLAAIFLGSFIFLGIGTNVSYNLFDLFGGSNQQQGGVTNDATDQIERAEKNLQENPEDPAAIKSLATLYLQNNQVQEAEKVLKKGREVAPKDEEVLLLLGQVYSLQTQTAAEEKQRRELYRKAGDAFAAATELEPEDETAYLLAGEAYDQAGEPDKAIKYWNGYLELEPDGEQAGAVKDRIAALLEGGEQTTGGAAGSERP